MDFLILICAMMDHRDDSSELDANEFGILQYDGFDSEFDSEAENTKRRKRQQNDAGLVAKRQKTTDGVAHKQLVTDEYSKQEGRAHRFHILSMDAYSRHKQFINNYLLYYGGSKQSFNRDRSKDKRDIDVIRENHRFIWEDEDLSEDTWAKRLAKKYYDKLFREYCIADLSRYKENKIGMRWRIEKEVENGKGQFSCGNKKCEKSDELRSWEVNFVYVEHEERKNALVKLRLCPNCSYKLNYKHKRKDVTKKSRKQRQKESDEVTNETGSDADDKNEESQEQVVGEAENETEDEPKSGKNDNIWAGPAKGTEEKSLNDEFDEYFEDMFL